MEAGAAGLPVVATKHAGIIDIIQDNETGFLVSENDIEGMAYYMKKFIVDPLLSKEMGAKAAQRIDKHFSLNRNVKFLWENIGGSFLKNSL